MGVICGILCLAIMGRILLHTRGRKNPLPLLGLALIIIGWVGVFFGRLLQAAVSRHRERLADASAVQFTRDPSGLTGALLKIAGLSAGSRLVTPNAEEVAHMLFAPGLNRLMATHPSLEQRLKELNPNFRASELPALAAAAVRDAQRLRQADAGFARSDADADTGTARPAPVSALAGNAAMIAAQAGTIASEQVQYAQRVRAAIPEGLRDFIDSADHARTLVLAVLVSKVPGAQAVQRRVLEEAWGPEFTAQVVAQGGLADALAPALRLPAVQQLFPALRRLSLAERQKLRDVVNSLALADARIDVFECCLTLLLAACLYDELEGAPLHGNASLLQETDSIHVLFCVLAAQGNGDAALAARAYEAGVSVVLPQQRPAFAEISDWPTELKDALARLVHLKPFAKKVLIEGMVRCIAHDRTLSVAEGELLRTVCAVLHCPLPPILGQEGLGQEGLGQGVGHGS